MAVSGPGPSAVRPRLVVSRCLGLEACRYDGAVVEAPFVRRLAEHVELVAVCPEVAIGLGVPRDPIRLLIDGASPDVERRRLVQPSTGRDLTAAMAGFAADFAGGAGPLDGAILKGRSPSCGRGDVKVFASAADDEPSGLATGLFAAGLAERWPDLPMVDEVGFEERETRDWFLTRVFALARLRAAHAVGTRAALTRFHAQHKLLLLAANERALRELGPRAAAGGAPLADAWGDYAARFAAALAAPPTSAGRANALMHAIGYFRERVAAAERRELSEALARRHRDPGVLDECEARLRGWITEAREPYLGAQALFWPYPDALR